VDFGGVIGVVLALFGIFVAFWVPIQMERRKRPVLMIEPAEMEAGVIGDHRARFAKIGVRNLPIRREDSPWYFPRIDSWLLRATATGCKVTASFEELATGGRPLTNRQMRWDAASEPLNLYVDATGSLAAHPDITKVPQSLSLDVAPDSVETIAVAIKYEGEEAAYAFDAWSYFHGGPRLFADPRLELAGEEYRVSVRAAAGGISVERTLRLRNYGDSLDDFRVVED
jgi:hypothetical protein